MTPSFFLDNDRDFINRIELVLRSYLSVIFASLTLRLEAVSAASVILLNSGRIEQHNSVSDITARPNSPFLASFLYRKE
jgi:ABC-type sulfate/molybdate transport systems ATPase subunit